LLQRCGKLVDLCLFNLASVDFSVDIRDSYFGDDYLRGGYVAGSSYHTGSPSSGACGLKQLNPNSHRSPLRHAHTRAAFLLDCPVRENLKVISL
jgi:hypothetical protein